MTHDVMAEILGGIDPEQFYTQYLPEIAFTAEGQSVKPVLCCFHEDSKPSLSIHLKKGFYCQACGAKGTNPIDFIYLWKTKRLGRKFSEDGAKAVAYSDYIHPLVSKSAVKEYHKVLLQSLAKQKELAERGVHLGLIKSFQIGYCPDDDRFTVPIKNMHGWYHDLRMIKNGLGVNGTIKNLPYDWKTSKKKREKGEKTHGDGGRLFPWKNILKDRLFLCEGEWDAMILTSWEHNALTGGGVNALLKYAESFKDKEIFIVFDNDKKDNNTNPGQEAAYKLTKAILKYRGTGSVKNIKLPLWGDVTDFWRQGNRKEEFQKLIDASMPQSVNGEEPIETIEDEYFPTNVEELLDSKNYGKLVVFTSRITGDEGLHYSVADEYGLRCDMQFSDKICPTCPLAPLGGHKVHKHIDHDNFLLSLMTIKDANVMGILKRKHDIDSRCNRVEKEVIHITNIQRVLIAPALERKEKKTSKENTLAYNFGETLELNIDYELKGYVHHDPHTQESACIILEATPKETLLQNFKAPKKDEVQKLKDKFGVPKEKLSANAIIKKHNDLMDIHAHNTTNIYNERHLHSVINLTYHSALQLNFDGMLINSYMESVIIGDTNTGKNYVLDSMSKLYKAGLIIDAKSTTTVGLIGGMGGGTAHKKCFSWGSYVQQHRKLIGLNEGSHLTHTIDALRVVREGKADYNKADAKRQTVCMTRLVILANDPHGSVASNPYGIMALPTLFKHNADISRFTAACFLIDDGENSDIINKRNPPQIKTPITQEDFQFVLLNAWSLAPENIDLKLSAVDKCYALAKKMGEKYRSSISLVQLSIMCKDLAKVATALAAEQYNMTPDGKMLEVTEEFVEAAYRIMQEWYDDPDCAYDEFAKQEQQQWVIVDVEEVMEIFDMERDAEENKRSGITPAITQLLSAREFNHQFITDSFMSVEVHSAATSTIKILLRNNCITRHQRNFVKTKVFIKFLQELLKKEKLDAKTS